MNEEGFASRIPKWKTHPTQEQLDQASSFDRHTVLPIVNGVFEHICSHLYLNHSPHFSAFMQWRRPWGEEYVLREEDKSLITELHEYATHVASDVIKVGTRRYAQLLETQYMISEKESDAIPSRA